MSWHTNTHHTIFSHSPYKLQLLLLFSRSYKCRQVRLGRVTQTVHVHSREVWVERHPASQQANRTTSVSPEWCCPVYNFVHVAKNNVWSVSHSLSNTWKSKKKASQNIAMVRYLSNLQLFTCIVCAEQPSFRGTTTFPLAWWCQSNEYLIGWPQPILFVWQCMHPGAASRLWPCA